MPQGPTPFGNGLYTPYMYLRPLAFANLPANPQTGMVAVVSDSDTTALGDTIAGGGSDKVYAVFIDPNWIVAAGVPTSADFTDLDISGNLTVGGFLAESYATDLTAVGTNRGNSLALTAQVNNVGTAASSAVGVTLPAAADVGVGGIVWVINDGPSNSFHVYGAGSDTIDGTAGATGVALTNAFQCAYQVNAAGAFISYRYAVTRSA